MPTTSLTLQAVLKRAASAAGFGGGGRPLSGLSAAAKGFAVAATAADGVTAVIVPNDAAVGQAVADIRFFLGGLDECQSASGLSRRLVRPMFNFAPFYPV